MYYLKIFGGSFLISVIGIFLIFDTELLTTAIIAGLISIAITVLIAAFATRCPNCGKFFAMSEVSRTNAGTQSTTVDVQREVRNNSGKVTRTYYEAVPATKHFYDCVEVCKHCGHRQNVIKENITRD